MAADELTSAPATALAALVAGRAVSARELVEAHLHRIAQVDGAVNAVVQVDAERALARARDADDALAAGRSWGPLHGVPFSVKDNIAVAGVVMAIGVPERAGVVAAEDATLVGRLRAAGAIALAKTNCPPYGGGIETDNPVYGRTSNPYDLARTPGGSSGGEAAAVAAGCSPCGVGTDSGASVRLPAHFCGLAALKPTARRVPLTGILDDEGQIGALSDPRTQPGPLARSVADVALLLRVIAGPDGRDGGVVGVVVRGPR
jgi:amidase